MEKTKAEIRVNKDKVNRLVKYKYLTIENFLKHWGISRMRYWQIINQPHLSLEVPSLVKLAYFLEVDVKEIIEEK